jgi:hypothetical protein
VRSELEGDRNKVVSVECALIRAIVVLASHLTLLL